ncbi:MAG: alpha/beta hydrolase [Blastocatellia bacterium]|nr:alpha/beta hydrolase [Blastocatellia bacterium]MCS7156570.1 alpha/beta hydrolase [Blastocatellia bacterium]MCX7751689.1 alpha/beta hydrolase [Blastocatellia bacterium]MDW8168790.1 alpha/beta hydrolase [Acidobacteriota bacterium]MDW8255671.1 alpha/beta hydrolase [Acidobacteriota bacterium]
MPFVRIPEGELYYRRVGTGPPLVLVNDWPFSHRYWEPLADQLARSYTVVAFDPRGIGRSRSFAQTAAHDVEAHAEDIHELITALDLGEVHVIAHALGAIPAVLSLHLHPQNVRTLTLLNPMLGPTLSPRVEKYIASAQLLLLLRQLAAVPLVRSLLFRGYALGRLPKAYRRILAEDLLQVDVRAAWEMVHSATEEITLRRFCAALFECARPILLVACRQDGWSSVETARWLFERIHAGRLVTMASPAHFPMLETPERLSDVLTEFYKKAGA